MVSLDTQQWPFSGVTTMALLIVVLYAILYQLQYVRRDPREPTIIGSSIPFIGHPLQMVLEGGKYVKELGIVHRSKQIFTLPVPGSRIYIVTDPALASAVQRASKALSFTPLIADATKRVMGLDAATVDIVRQNLDPEPGEPRGFLADLHDVVYTTLGPGPLLNEFSLDAAREMARQVNAFADGLRARPEGGSAETLDLLSWMQHLVTVGTARFMYGPKNPIAVHPELEQAFWDFDHGLGPLLINIFPAVTATKPYRGREALVRAFAEYIEAGHHRRDASVIARLHIETSTKHGFGLDGQARGEVSFLFAGIINTAITTFWLVLRIFADKAILAAVRAEIEAVAASTALEEHGEGGSDDDEEVVLGLDAVRTRCRTLHAVFRECLRVGSDNYSTRLVKQDTLLADRHFLAAGSVVQISGGTMHADEGIWGAGAALGGAGFDHERFLRIDGREVQVHPAAFRAFGGGRTLCPGRHFATSEILALAAALVSVLEVEGAGEGGELRVPEKNDRVLPVHILEPRVKDKVGVRVRLRGGGRGRRARIVA